MRLLPHTLPRPLERFRLTRPPTPARAAVMVILSVCLQVMAAAGQAPTRVEAGRTQVRAEKATQAPEVDGRLSEAIWQEAQFIGGFVQREPRQGEPATQPTAVAFVYTEDALYVGARMGSDSGGVRALVTRRDREETSDQLIISLDTHRDLRTAYTFAVTAAGVRIDYYHASDFEYAREYGYDPVWEAKTVVDSAGWTAEVRIPFTQLRFNAAEVQTWGVNVVRRTPERDEEVYWQLVGRSETGWASRMGELIGIAGIRPSRRIELFPYVASEARVFSEANAADPFSRKQETAWRAGGDVKLGLGPSLTLEATINPDFGQVEADPAEVNLTAFETFFSERRPFFIEGTQILGGRGEFYSRRIGAPPAIRPPASFSETRTNSTILGAAKVSGRLSSGLSLGLLTALTDREGVRTFDASSGSFGAFEVAPRTGYGVLALRQEFGQVARTSGVGTMLLTAVERDLKGGSLLAAILNQRAYTGLVDYRVRWNGGQYDVSAYLGYSYIAGDSLALLQQQRSSRRYYQRPDADYVELDPRRTSLFGWKAGINHSKLSGKHLLWDIDYFEESPGLELNDIGSIGTTDDRGIVVNLRYRETTPGRHLRGYEMGVQGFNEWNYGGTRTATEAVVYGSVQLKNFWQVNTRYELRPRAYSDNLTRGGPLMQTGEAWQVNGSLGGRPGSRTRWRVGLSSGADELDGWFVRPTVSLSLRPGSRWEVSLDPAFYRGTNARQYLTTLAGGRTETYGARYVFSHVDRSEAALRVRLNFAITPDLTLETYAEPFASSGRFHGFGELQAARSRFLRVYGSDGTTISSPDSAGRRTVRAGGAEFVLPNYDFNVRSFRSNVVLRWEWRPGSTMYAVWQQNRRSDELLDRTVGVGDIFDSFSAPGDNFLAIKVNYWLPVR